MYNFQPIELIISLIISSEVKIPETRLEHPILQLLKNLHIQVETL